MPVTGKPPMEEKVPLTNSSEWPECYGFTIYGNGPCYVIMVQRGSVAQQAGILPGDQLLELDGHNVMDMSSDAVKTLAKHSRTVPPTLGVVSRVKYAELIANRKWGYGLTLKGLQPTHVDNVDPQGPAYSAGIRIGDLVLEVNGKKITSLEPLQSLLNTKYGRLTVTVVPVEIKDEKMEKRPIRRQDSRVHRARDLFAKMNTVLGSDYERKMAIVGLLKQYAEDRQVEKFSSALSMLLVTPHHRRLVRDIRPFVPVKHRSQFDAILKHDPLHASHSTNLNVVNASSRQSTAALSAISNYTAGSTAWPEGDVRQVRVHRGESGSFGFILRGHEPVFVETITGGGAADKAGLVPGDAILRLNGLDVRKSSHNHLVRLLQGSGHAPVLEVRHMFDENGDPINFQGTLGSDESSSSSHESSGWLSEEGHLVDRDGNSFRQRVDHLLTSKERHSLKRALMNYNMNRNVSQLVDDLSLVLDAPSKKTLWAFLLPRMSPEHREYVARYVDLPKHQLQSMLEGAGLRNQREGGNPSFLHGAASDSGWNSDLNDAGRMGSFRQQLEYLLTSRERSQLKKTLQIYSEKRNVHNLVEDLAAILDTPSKKTLWFYIIPLLPPAHQTFCQRRLGLPEHVIKTGSEGRFRKGPNGFRTLPGASASPRKGDVMYQQDDFRYVGQAADMIRDGFSSDEDEMVSSDLRSRRRLHVGHAKGVDLQGRYSPYSVENAEMSTYVLNPEYVDIHSQTLTSSMLRSKLRDNVAQTSSGYGSHEDPQHRQHGNKTIVKVYTSPQKRASIYEVPDENGRKDNEHSQIQTEDLPIYATVEPRGARHRGQNGKSGNDSSAHPMGSDVDSDSSTAKNSVMSYDSFQSRAMKAIKALDEVVANEPSDLDTRSMLGLPSPTSPVSMSLPTVPVPPPIPPPPPAPPPLFTANGQSSMHVKRINWEKLDVVDENTIWAQLGDSEDLDDVVKYLELEQQFSTKKTKLADSFKDAKDEVYILSPKKAYNMSILLGHLKRPASEFKRSLYQMDERILTPELLKQMLAYAPDHTEMEKYKSYKGPMSELSKPDQFVYQLSQVPGYEDRLKALFFKANFAEKVDEVEQNLTGIRKASLELRQSRKLAKILELVLAMGNYMNKGNARVGQAAGFRVSFLSQLELTKTSDGKSNFLHVLIEAVKSKYPECLNLTSDVPSVHDASKVSGEAISQELSELRKVLEEISTTVNKLSSQQAILATEDKFQDIMGHFISTASDEIQGLFSLHADTTEEFKTMVIYFGEDPKKVDTTDIFGTFSDFIHKFEKAQYANKQPYKNPAVLPFQTPGTMI